MVTDVDRMNKFIEVVPPSSAHIWWEHFAKANGYWSPVQAFCRYYFTLRLEDMYDLFTIPGYRQPFKAADVAWIMSIFEVSEGPILLRANGPPSGGFQGLTNLGNPWKRAGVMTYLGYPSLEVPSVSK